MKLDLTDLPTDPVLLQQLVRDLAAALLDRDHTIHDMKHRLAQLLRQRFGAKAEKFNPDQLLLFAGQAQAALEAAEAAAPPSAPKPESSAGHGRKPLPENLPRRRTVHPLPPEEQVCKDCGGALHEIGRVVTSQLDYVPASLVVVEQVRVTYAGKPCAGNVVTSELPPQPIEKGLPGAGLLAHVVTSKYADHLPLYRQEKIFARQGVALSRSTLADWTARTAELLAPVVEAMKLEVLRSKVIHTDDSPIPVLDSTKERTREGRIWGYVGDRAHPHTVYEYTPDHRQDGPHAFLRDFRGYLQADAYSGYDGIYATGRVREVACWAHARRGFFEAQETDAPRALVALGLIRKLYEIEEEARELSSETRKALRQERARPVLDEFRRWLDAQALVRLPKSPIGKAVGYALNQWTALTVYLEDGDLAIDNNAAERALRGLAVGRKNWRFVGSDEGGRNAAVLMSVMASCARHELDPFAYVRDVLERISTHPAREITALMPANWESREGGTGEGGASRTAAEAEGAVAEGTPRAATPEG